MLASTFMDMVLGVDIHFEMVPMPAPVPTPIPNPFVGMVFDPAGLLTGQAMGLAMALLSGKAPKGPVIINGMPATTVGTQAKNSLGVPHILIPPGTAWAPMPKMPRPRFKGPPDPPGPPVAPEGDAISVFGSATVTAMGSSAVRMGDKSMSCGEPVRLPSSTVLAIPKGMPVMIGGPPALSLSDAVGALLKTKWVAGPLHDLLSRMKPGRLRNLLSKAVCFLTGHPVDVASGRVLTDHVDWSLPGPLPLAFERSYSSAWANRSGPLGHGWSHSLDQAVWTERGKVVYLDGEGREIEFDTFDLADHVLRAGQSIFEPITRLTLKALGQRRFEIVDADGVTHEFAPVPGATGARRDWSRLIRKRSRAGETIQLEYDGRGNLEWVRDSARRSVGFAHDPAGRLTSVKLPHPTQNGWVTRTRYVYDAAGDLVEVIDPLQQSWRFKYKGHLLVQETNRNGLSFFFAYDSHGEDAFCVRTWGDGGIYDHVITYDKAGKLTAVTNSLGHTTTYSMNAVGCVVKVVDALGGTTAYEYDERSLQRTKETNPVGGETKWQYDDRGNCTKVVGPDEATVQIVFDNDLAIEGVDPIEGRWKWGRDGKGRLIGRIDPLGRRMQFRWDGTRIVGVTDPAGHETFIGYDAQGNVSSLRSPDGGESKWQHDNLGRVVAAIDGNGNVQQRELDALDRVVRVREPDGNVRELAYDPEGNVILARDRQHDVRFTYQGMDRLASRTEAGTTVGFSYDTEEQLTAITNEHGSVYRFQLGPTGEVDIESGFDGIRRKYERDAAGRVQRTLRPARRETEYTFDAVGRVLAIAHEDGTSEKFSYRLDGALLEAKNDAAPLKFERDALGRLVKEVVGEEWVSSEYDQIGLRSRVRSSKGLDQRIQRNATGQVVGVRATVEGADEAFETRIRRDALGLELERALPGGVQSRWERDKLGRPVRHEISAGPQVRGAWSYTWDVNDRLRQVSDALRGPTRYEHDGIGNLAAAVHADGRIDLRLPDAVGNLFRTNDRSDRKYGPAGQLLEARRDDGGFTRYEYDPEGNLVRKLETDAGGQELSVWTYHWNGAGMLAKVVRPDGDAVEMKYDALGRRLEKRFRGRTTKWLWDGNVPVHEWAEEAPPAPVRAPAVDSATVDEVADRRRRAALAAHPAQGPPTEPGTPDAPITWLFDPESFAPMAKVVGDARYSIITDHLGTATSMYDASGHEVWSATLDAYGDVRQVIGDRQSCPFRWPGQYEDAETGLYYNRFRYYDPEAGSYVSQDPIGLEGGPSVYAYVRDPLSWQDPLGLAACGTDEKVIVLGEGMGRVKAAVRDLQKRGVNGKWYQAWGKNFPKNRPMAPHELDAALARNERWLVSKIKEGYKIFDIGHQPGRVSPSPFYQREQAVLARLGYPTTPLPGY
jgi:RHS repeat-associated protein